MSAAARLSRRIITRSGCLPFKKSAQNWFSELWLVQNPKVTREKSSSSMGREGHFEIHFTDLHRVLERGVRAEKHK
jgi:hypothetical protein